MLSEGCSLTPAENLTDSYF